MALFTMRGIRENEENMKINVKFDFYEQRPYIHSTQLLYELLKIMKDNNYYKEEKDLIKISCTYKVMADKQGYYIIDEVYSGSYNAIFTIQTVDRKITAYYIGNDEPVVNRVPYDEIHIIDGYSIDIDNKIADVKICRDDNLYNVIIALGKRLLLSAFNSEDYSSWKVGKFVVNWQELHNQPIGKKLSFQITNNINDEYIQSKIYIDDKYIGILENARRKIGSK